MSWGSFNPFKAAKSVVRGVGRAVANPFEKAGQSIKGLVKDPGSLKAWGDFVWNGSVGALWNISDGSMDEIIPNEWGAAKGAIKDGWEDTKGILVPAAGAALMFTPLAPIGAGMLMGSMFGAGMAALQGADWEALNEASFSGGLIGGVTAGAGVAGSAVGKAAYGTQIAGQTVGKVGATAIGAGAGAGLGYGGARLAGADGTTALISAGSAGLFAGANAYQNIAEVEAFNKLAATYKPSPVPINGMESMTWDQVVAAGGGAPKLGLTAGSIGMMETMKNMGKWTAALGLLGGMGSMSQMPDFQPIVQTAAELKEAPKDPAPLSPINGKPEPVLDPLTNGSAWDRSSGELFGGLDTLAASLPDFRSRTTKGLSNEMLLKNGAMIGA